MHLMEVLGYFLAVLIGVTLGLFGAGGSILTLPVLYYVFGIETELGTAYSLFIVGTTALAGAIPNMKRKTINYKAAIVFSIPSLITVYLTRAYLLNLIPDNLGTIGSRAIDKNLALLILFSIIMILAAISMIRNRKTPERSEGVDERYNYPMIFAEGAVVGVVTGLVGAGGGFLIIPALVLFAKLPMRIAVGTSLLIIAIKSLVGFLGDVQSGQPLEWGFLAIFTSLTIAGILLGGYLSKFLPAQKLKGAFGWFVLAMGLLILFEELILHI